jgi:hypothetical protein
MQSTPILTAMHVTLGHTRTVSVVRKPLNSKVQLSVSVHNLYFSANVIRLTKFKMDEMGRACSMHGKDEKCVQNFDWKI